jgi:hypothetical protein
MPTVHPASPRVFLAASLCAVAAAAAAAAAGCSSYAPDLGDAPFRCGTDEPRCPDGYECVEYSSSTKVCERADGDGERPDAADVGPGCNDDSSIEPNDDPGNATLTPIPDFDTDVSFVRLAICPSTDKDLFRFRVDVADQQNVKATVTTPVAEGQLLLSILNGDGQTIVNGAPASDTTIVASLSDLSTGVWYVQVAAPDGVENNYALQITTCQGAPCP